ncbi:MAG: biopolymer transporter ExbD [Planctomycetota bacterium]
MRFTPTRRTALHSMGTDKSDAAPLSMIDIVFLLLIFFLCATKFRVPEADLDAFLPRDRGTASQYVDAASYPCVVHLARANGRVLCRADDRDLPTGPLEWLEQHTGVPGPDMEALEAHLRQRQELSDSSRPLNVVIDADPDVPAKYVVGVVNRCAKLEITDVAIVERELSID